MPKDPPSTSKKWKGSRATLSWQSAGTESLKELIARITDSGNAVMFSKTIDGSALSLTIFSGNTKSKEYVTEVGDIVPLFAWALEEYS